MIISHGRRYIFIHVPKTGGTSMALALESRAMKNDIMLGDTPKAIKRRRRVKSATASGRLWKHSRLKDIHGLVDQTQIEEYFVFTLVRNPWDRLVSYYHWLGDQSFDHPAVELAKSLTFSQFLNNAQIQQSLQSAPFDSYVSDAGGVCRCDLFVRLEHLENDKKAIETHLGFNLEIPHINQSRREGGYRSAYSQADRDLAENLLQRDISRFGYEF